MKQIVVDQNKLAADFLVNIGVAWFAAGVIGPFFNKNLDLIQELSSAGWGLAFSSLCLLLALSIIKNKLRRKRK